jgi:hypothetical protein
MTRSNYLRGRQSGLNLQRKGGKMCLMYFQLQVLYESRVGAEKYVCEKLE